MSIFVTVTSEDRYVAKKNAWSRAEVCVYPEGISPVEDNKHKVYTSETVDLSALVSLPEYASEMLNGGKVARITKKNKSYDALRAEATASIEAASAPRVRRRSETVPTTTRKRRMSVAQALRDAYPERSIEDIMAEAEGENAKRDASTNATPSKVKDYSKLTRADLIRRLEAK